MLGERVEHPQFGAGQVVALYRNGAEWLVRFDNGLRFRRPSTEFGESNTITTETVDETAAYTPPAPMPLPQRAARNLVESLRMGIAPSQFVSELTIGLDDELASVRDALNQAHQHGGAVRAVLGEYGFGKSHIIELTAQEAKERNFLVTTVSLDLMELPPHRAFAIYADAARHIQYPDVDEIGVRPLMEKAAQLPDPVTQLRDISPAELDPLIIALNAFTQTSSSRQRKLWLNWLMGGRKTYALNKDVPRGIKFPSIYKNGHNARQIAFLFTGLSALARLVGYSGLCVLVDEAESYSLLKRYQRPKATTFFRAMVYACLRDEQDKISPDSFPQHRFREYPLTYDNGQSLFFMFTITHSDNRLPLQEWLTDDQVFTLKPDADVQEIGRFLEKLLAYHAQAFSYEPEERHTQVRRGAAEHLASGLRNGKLSMRRTVRLTMTLYDLLYQYPDYSVAQLLDELRSEVR